MLHVTWRHRRSLLPARGTCEPTHKERTVPTVALAQQRQGWCAGRALRPPPPRFGCGDGLGHLSKLGLKNQNTNSNNILVKYDDYNCGCCRSALRSRLREPPCKRCLPSFAGESARRWAGCVSGRRCCGTRWPSAPHWCHALALFTLPRGPTHKLVSRCPMTELVGATSRVKSMRWRYVLVY